MIQITVSDYLMGREKTYGAELTEQMRANAAATVTKANLLLAAMYSAGIGIEVNPHSGTPVSSGWRPAEINGATVGAAPRSKHMSCQAVDLFDPEGDLDEWCLANPEILERFGLWQEHPSATKGWCHVQTLPPRSGNRVFYP